MQRHLHIVRTDDAGKRASAVPDPPTALLEALDTHVSAARRETIAGAMSSPPGAMRQVGRPLAEDSEGSDLSERLRPLAQRAALHWRAADLDAALTRIGWGDGRDASGVDPDLHDEREGRGLLRLCSSRIPDRPWTDLDAVPHRGACASRYRAREWEALSRLAEIAHVELSDEFVIVHWHGAPLFHTAQDTLTSLGRAHVVKLAELARALRERTISLVCHSEEGDDGASSAALRRGRAESLGAVFIACGHAPHRIIARGLEVPSRPRSPGSAHKVTFAITLERA